MKKKRFRYGNMGRFIQCIMNIIDGSKNENLKTFFSVDVWAKTLSEYIIPGRLFGQNIILYVTFYELLYACFRRKMK